MAIGLDLYGVETSPCNGCRYRLRCAMERMACERFTMFAYGSARSRWINAPMAPTTARYSALFEDAA